ncbi:pyridoxine/pyridoxamine 5'-phosphate oxidase [Drosophila montana]|uniref:pyridoxine/pyridoxamine 5'-phosphate oxidase n=1 Tax=Drosophila montana TaxID=40370 RepID=UPI00313D3A8E
MKLGPALKQRLRGVAAAMHLLAPRSRKELPMRRMTTRAASEISPELHECPNNIAIREPYAVLQNWLSVALNEASRCEPRAACLATVDMAGQPVTRMTNVEQINAAGLTFYTTLGSRLTGEITNNPHVSLQFFWPHVKRSVHIAGHVSPVCALQAQLQFARYPREVQLSMHGIPSKRSGRIMEYFAKLFKSDREQDVPLPRDWGGLLLSPTFYEFSQVDPEEPGRRCMRFRRCLTMPRGMRNETCNADRYDWVFDSCTDHDSYII